VAEELKKLFSPSFLPLSFFPVPPGALKPEDRTVKGKEMIKALSLPLLSPFSFPPPRAFAKGIIWASIRLAQH